MSEVDRIENWNYCIKKARKIMFLDGYSELYESGDQVYELPGDQTF